METELGTGSNGEYSEWIRRALKQQQFRSKEKTFVLTVRKKGV